MPEQRGELPVDGHLGDMADFPAPSFALVYVVASTSFLLDSHQRQVSCFRSLAASLVPVAGSGSKPLRPQLLVVNLFQVEDVADSGPSGVIAEAGVLDDRDILAMPLDKAAFAWFAVQADGAADKPRSYGVA